MRRALDIARTRGAPAEGGLTCVNLHELYCAARLYGAAEPHYLAGIAYCEEHDLGVYLGCRYDAALALLDSGEENALRQALEIFTELGAGAAVKLTRRALRRLGVRSIPVGPRSATRADEFGLTRREHEVLTLIAEGLTNAEIAARLYISAKTVDRHVSAVLGKLGVSTRAQAASRHTRST